MRRINPERKTNSLKVREMEILFDSMKMVLNIAIDRKVKVENFPENFIISHRNEKDECPVCGDKIKKIKVNGRGTYYCARCQK